MTYNIKNEESFEIIIIDNDKLFISLIHMLFELENINHKSIISFKDPLEALEYLSKSKNKTPKLIFLEILDKSGLHDFTFFEGYPLLQRNDYICIVTVSIVHSYKIKCLSNQYISKYLNKPIVSNDIKTILSELRLIINDNNRDID